MDVKSEVYSFAGLVAEMGDVGQQLTALEACEGAAGNISIFVRQLDVLDAGFNRETTLQLPIGCPALAGGWLVVTGSGRRLRDIHSHPGATLCVLKINPDGTQARLFSAGEVRPTSELNSHLAIHNDQVKTRPLSYHAIVHAQPRTITYLSHIPRYLDTRALNRRLLRWEPESILTFPEGIGMIPFQIPGSDALMAATVECLRKHRAVIWQRHGMVTRSDLSVSKAGDMLEYAEAAAEFEIMNLQLGEPSQGLSDEELRRICAAANIQQEYF